MEPLGKVIILQHAHNTLAVYQRVLFDEPCRDCLVFTRFHCPGPPSQSLIELVADLSSGSQLAFLALSTGTNVWPGGFDEPRIKDGWEQVHAAISHRLGLARVVITPEQSALSNMVHSARDMLQSGELARL